jgi:hypothetical protein
MLIGRGSIHRTLHGTEFNNQRRDKAFDISEGRYVSIHNDAVNASGSN